MIFLHYLAIFLIRVLLGYSAFSHALPRGRVVQPRVTAREWLPRYGNAEEIQLWNELHGVQKRGIAHDIGRGTTKLFSLLEPENHKTPEKQETPAKLKTAPKSDREESEPAPELSREDAAEPVEKNSDDESVKVNKGSSFIFYNGRPLQIEGKPVVKRDVYRRPREFYDAETFYDAHVPEPTHPQGPWSYEDSWDDTRFYMRDQSSPQSEPGQPGTWNMVRGKAPSDDSSASVDPVESFPIEEFEYEYESGDGLSFEFPDVGPGDIRFNTAEECSPYGCDYSFDFGGGRQSLRIPRVEIAI
ncbi:hypothetical protein RUND412_010354 [Rhizina undulata]